MIRTECECNICGTKEYIEPDYIVPKGWTYIYDLFEDGKYAHICPECWRRIKEFAERLHEEERYH